MESPFNKNIDGIGEVLFHQNRNAKAISIKVLTDNTIKVVYPPNTPTKFLLDCIEKSRTDIIAAQGKMADLMVKAIVFDENTHFETQAFRLVLKKETRCDFRMELLVKNKTLTFLYPTESVVTSPEVQNMIRQAIDQALVHSGKHFFPPLVQQLAEKHDFKFKKISVKLLKKTWGICSSTGNISLNAHLLRLPLHLIEYAILHELCHTVHQNHGKEFWELLDRVSDGKSAEYREEFRSFRIAY